MAAGLGWWELVFVGIRRVGRERKGGDRSPESRLSWQSGTNDRAAAGRPRASAGSALLSAAPRALPGAPVSTRRLRCNGAPEAQHRGREYRVAPGSRRLGSPGARGLAGGDCRGGVGGSEGIDESMKELKARGANR